MALRENSSTKDSSGSSFHPDYYVEVVSKLPFKDIEGFCIWQYRIMANAALTEVRELMGKVGLVVSARIDIKKPELYPQCNAIHGTSVTLAPNDDRQYVYRIIDPATAISGPMDLFFIAPCEEDSYTAVCLVRALSEGGTWVTVPFRVGEDSSSCTTHVMRGPAVITPVCEVPPPPERALLRSHVHHRSPPPGRRRLFRRRLHHRNLPRRRARRFQLAAPRVVLRELCHTPVRSSAYINRSPGGSALVTTVGSRHSGNTTRSSARETYQLPAR